MNNIKKNKIYHEFNDKLIKQIDLDIESPMKLKSFFEIYYLLHFEIDNNIQKVIDDLSNKKYTKR
jgi:hypothetical protein